MISVILLFAAFAQCIQAASVFEKCENDYQCLSTPILLKCISFTSTSLCVPPDYDKVLLAGSKRFYSFDDKLQREILGYYFGLEIINDDAEISYETAETNEFKKRTSRQLVVDEESASKERRLLENESPLITDDIYDEDYNEWKLLRDWDKLGDLTDGFFTDIESLAHPTFPIKNKIVESEWPKRAATESIKNEADKSSQQTRKKRNRNVHRNGRNLGYFYSSLSFSGKLYKELNKNEFPHLLSWSKDGNGVCLLLTDDEFKEKVLPLLCNGKINSLVRQMYIHGFRQRGFYDINSKMQCFRNRDERFRRSFNDTKPSPISHEKPVNLLDLYPSTINCKNTIPKVTNKTIQVMINLHNSAPVIQSILHALIQSTKYHTIRIAIQHDSTDETHDILLKFQHLFKNIVIKQGVAQNYDKTNRIEILSNIRNKVLEISDLKADVVLFLNDIVLCPNDITNLIDSHFINHAHVTCGMDYLIYNSKLYFYDVWTARTITGNLFYEIGDTWKPNDLFTIDQDLQTRILYEKNLAFPVYSCWNGIVAIEPEIFKQGVLFRKDQECIASECTTFCKDAWGIGFGRILVDPLIRVAYNERDYIAANKDNQGGRETQGSIDWKTVEKPKQVVCYPWDGLGKYVNVWKNRTLVLA